MYLTADQVVRLDEQGLREFLGLQIHEGHHLDYKLAFSGKSQTAQHANFLKDVASFANANGGHIFLGVLEPSGISIDEQLFGIEDGEEIARDLERLAASGAIDPRIAGLVIHPVRLQNGKHVVVVHIPPSLGKPHMVYYDKKYWHYIRHSESSQPMTSYDIRQAVLTSASVEVQAREYMHRMICSFDEDLLGDTPGFILQAVPLIQPEQPLDVNTDDVFNVLQDKSRSRMQHTWGLRCMPRPGLTIDGIQGLDDREDPKWQVEFHRTGYIGVAFKIARLPQVGTSAGFSIHQYYRELFLSFAAVSDDLLAAVSFDAPYAVACDIIRAKGTFFQYEGSFGDRSRPCKKDTLHWPNRFRQPGESFRMIAEEWITVMYHAYGVDASQ